MCADPFAVVADPTRRRILHELIEADRSVGELVGSLGLSQPTVSKHLKVLRDKGFVASRTSAQQRIYRLDERPFAELEAWLGPFRQKWNVPSTRCSDTSTASMIAAAIGDRR